MAHHFILFSAIKSKLKPDHKGRNTFRTSTFVIHRSLSAHHRFARFSSFLSAFSSQRRYTVHKDQGNSEREEPRKQRVGWPSKETKATRTVRRCSPRSVLCWQIAKIVTPASAPWGIEGKALGRITRAKRFCRRQRHGVPISLAAQIRRTAPPSTFSKCTKEEESESNLRVIRVWGASSRSRGFEREQSMGRSSNLHENVLE